MSTSTTTTSAETPRALHLSGRERERIRVAAGLSRAKLAKRLNVTPQSIYHWERELYAPSAENRSRYVTELRKLREERIGDH